jgi:hypothetical protein
MSPERRAATETIENEHLTYDPEKAQERPLLLIASPIVVCWGTGDR